jgi:hypothetical protein
MQNSAEIRWFWHESLPTGIESWFHSGSFAPGGKQSPPRVDEYLLDFGQTEIGLKKRGSKTGIEVKGLVATLSEPISIEPFSGQIQLWTKWTMESLRLNGLKTIRTFKKRRLRKYAIDGSLREIQLGPDEVPDDPTEKLPEQGCNVELTAVSFAETGPTWWTIGFEAFGPFHSVEQNLRRTLHHLAGPNVPKLTSGQELSYPAWLSAYASL